ncbi:MAG: hypothetical protein IPM54_23450 [Polyangiaceae bacterium]|nr:hypothetical protein [Polyangiaceae bacterium]
MKRFAIVSVLAIAAFALMGCAAHSPDHHAAHSAEHRSAPTLAGPPARAVEFPAPVGNGQPREVRVLVDEPALKLVSIVLRQGTVLPEHHSAVPVTIQAVHGAGTVVAGSERFRIDGSHAVVLAPNVPHAVEPDAGTDIVLLVHHMGRAAEHHH